MFNLGTCDVDQYEGEERDDADVHEAKEASQANNGSKQYVKC
jgi:hypothetical protein